MCKAHVTFDEIKRILSFEKGEDVQGLRYHFIRAFSDVFSDEVPPAGVKFQRFDEHFKDFVDLPNEEKLEEDIKVKAIIVPKREHQAQGDFPRKHAKWYQLTSKEEIIVNKTYRSWNPVNNAILHRHSSDGEVYCDGSLDSTTTNMVVLVRDSGNIDLYRLYFNTNYVVVGQGAGTAITTIDSRTNPTLSDDSEFEVSSIGAYTMFKNKKYGQYLGCDGSKTAILMHMENEFFPNPQALFIANMYTLPPN